MKYMIKIKLHEHKHKTFKKDFLFLQHFSNHKELLSI